MSARVAPLGTARLAAVLALGLVILGALALPAFATEAEGEAPVTDEGPAPSIDEIGTHNEISDQYRPEATELPPFQPKIIIPLAIVSIVMVAGILFLYLTWQPRFAEERRSKRRR